MLLSLVLVLLLECSFDCIDVNIPCLGASPFFSLFSSPLFLCCVNCSSPFYIDCPPFFSLLLLLPLLLFWLFFLLISSPYVGFIWYVVLYMLIDQVVLVLMWGCLGRGCLDMK